MSEVPTGRVQQRQLSPPSVCWSPTSNPSAETPRPEQSPPPSRVVSQDGSLPLSYSDPHRGKSLSPWIQPGNNWNTSNSIRNRQVQGRKYESRESISFTGKGFLNNCHMEAFPSRYPHVTITRRVLRSGLCEENTGICWEWWSLYSHDKKGIYLLT